MQSSPVTSGWVKRSIIVLITAVWFLNLHGAPQTNVLEFQSSIAEPGSIQWQINQSKSRQQQELYRKHLTIPDLLGTNIPLAANAYVAVSPPATTPPSAIPTNPLSDRLKIFFYAALFVAAGAWMLRRLAPQLFADLFNWNNPWAVKPAAVKAGATKVRSEEKAFGEFLTEFRGGPSGLARADAREPNDALGEFYVRAKKNLAAQRKVLQEIGREASDPLRHKMLENLCNEMRRLKGEAGAPATLLVWQVASALEGLLRQLTEKMRNVSPSTLRTVNAGVDLLDDLCVPGLQPDLTTRPFNFLVVDDDLISRQALSLALKKAFSQPDLAVDGETALAQVTRQAYDVIFLDVEMPGMNGFELCTAIRKTDFNHATPVVFVTGQSDFAARAQSTLSGGNDLMGKPFLIFEITVKALTLALRGRVLHGVQKIPPAVYQNGHTNGSGENISEIPRRVSNSILTSRPVSTKPTAAANPATYAFLNRAATNIGPLQELCQTILQTADDASRQTLLADGFMRLSAMAVQADGEVEHPAFQMSTALEGLFRKLLEDTKNSSPTTLGTVAAAVELLNDLCVPGLKTDLATYPPIQMLVVDDDLIARRALVGALQTAFQKPEHVDNGEAALALALEKTFDVIFLDVQMPGLDGFAVCAKIRESIPNRTTPVVFVTGHGDFAARAEMTRNGGDDMVGKPILNAEIIVKALTFALRGRLQQLQ